VTRHSETVSTSPFSNFLSFRPRFFVPLTTLLYILAWIRTLPPSWLKYLGQIVSTEPQLCQNDYKEKSKTKKKLARFALLPTSFCHRAQKTQHNAFSINIREKRASSAARLKALWQNQRRAQTNERRANHQWYNRTTAERSHLGKNQ